MIWKESVGFLELLRVIVEIVIGDYLQSIFATCDTELGGIHRRFGKNE